MDKNKLLDAVSRVALIAGMVVLGVFAFLGLIKLATKTLPSLASVGTSLRSAFIFPNKNTLTLSLSNNSVNTGESTSVSFEKKNSDAGSYVFRFDCDGKNLSMVVFQGTNQTQLPCNATTTLSSNQFTIIPNLENKNSFVDAKIYVDYIKAGEKNSSESGKTVLTVHNGTLKNSDVAKTPLATSTQTVSTSTKSNKIQTPSVITSGTTTNKSVDRVIRKADLDISMKDSGILTASGFFAKSTFNQNESPSVRFDIGNDGNTPTGPWQFSAVLPTNPGQVFASGIQPSLAPGEVIEYTLTLANLASSGNNVISVHVDNLNTVNELSETNNVGVLTISKSGSSIISQGKADLSGRVLTTGFVDRTTGQFFESNSISQSSRAAVKFEIENMGSYPSGNFVFTADLPSTTNSYYTSPSQNTLLPGEKREYTVSFDPRYTGSNNVTIRIDQNSNVSESNENNNTITSTLYVY